MEEVEAQPDAVIVKFLVKSFTAIVLFDTGASHSYITRGFVNKFKSSWFSTKTTLNLHLNEVRFVELVKLIDFPRVES